MILLAVDTGSVKSAYVVVDSQTYVIEDSGKIPNDAMMEMVRNGYFDECVVEMFSHYGGKSGSEVFDSVLMIGRVLEACIPRETPACKIRRIEVKEHICGTPNAKDQDVILALQDRFGSKGTKENHGFFWGMTADRWQAFALAVTYIDRIKEGKCNANQVSQE